MKKLTEGKKDVLWNLMCKVTRLEVRVDKLEDDLKRMKL